MRRATRLVFTFAVFASGCAGARRDPIAPPAPVPSTARSPDPATAVLAGPFALHSAFRPNLHHFLYALSRARKGLDAERPAITMTLADAADLGRLSAEERAGWDRALAHYAAEVAARDAVFDELLVEAKGRLVACPEDRPIPSCGLPSALAQALEDGAPAYRRLWWPAHDRANREWIAAVTPLVRTQGGAMQTALARAFAFEWPTASVRVDVVAYANWAGAYTTREPSLVTISSRAPDSGGTFAFESLFHEVMHTLDDGLSTALGDAARVQNKRTRGIAHTMVFYSVGELTRRRFPGHTPYAEAAGLWKQTHMARVLPVLRTHWQPFLEGRTSFEEAVRAVVAAL